MKNFIINILNDHFTEDIAKQVYTSSYLLQYLDKKTKSVNRSSKARGSYANLYAIYVLIEDYIKKGFLDKTTDYSTYDGLIFTEALRRIRELPFGTKIQNHALNNRCNDEFRKFFNTYTNEVPIIRNLVTKRYWINETLLKIDIGDQVINLAPICNEIVEKYVDLKMINFNTFFDDLIGLKKIVATNPDSVVEYVSELLNPNSDARIFEIVSYVIIKYHFITQKITYSINDEKDHSVPLMVYKVGRTNANDGGIDYIMKPLGRIFQVTEVLDFRKYFLDIDKLIHYPITFVVKQDIEPTKAMERIVNDAQINYSDPSILNSYISSFEEIITIPTLKKMLITNITKGFLTEMVDELIVQCKVEYNIE